MNLNKRAVMVFAGLLIPALGAADGSIVINNGAPRAELMFRSASGESRQLNVSWTDIQVLGALRRYLTAEFGATEAEALPFTLNRQRLEVSFYNPRSGAYETLPFVDLLSAQE